MNTCIDINACCIHERENRCRGGEAVYIACLQSHLDCPRCADKARRIAELTEQLSELKAASPFIDGVDIMRDRAKRAEEWREKARAYIREGKTGLSHPDEYRALMGPRT